MILPVFKTGVRWVNPVLGAFDSHTLPPEIFTTKDTKGTKGKAFVSLVPLGVMFDRPLILAAHQDDESLGCGILLQRAKEAVVVFATNGAPRNEYFWKAFGSRENYAAVRAKETEAALALVNARQFTLGEIADQELYLHLADAMTVLQRIIADTKPSALLTSAYEGGHPDHDCCAFLASFAGAKNGIPVWEFPLYHRDVNGEMVRQTFVTENGTEATLQASAEESARKQRLLAAYRSQAHVVNEFHCNAESFRPMAAYDFTKPPHAGTLNYESWKFPVKPAQLIAAFVAVPG